jgi:xanthine dehydrogenase accessory factor
VKELQEIVIAFDRAQQAGKLTALATVVHVDGSSYRRAGARMLVTDDGELTGAISGGCLEGDALRKARLVMAKQTSLLVTYDTTDDDDAKFGVGLGCNGIIHILIEPINADHEHNPIAFFKRFLSSREPVVLVTIFNMNNRHGPQYGTCLLVDQQGGSIGVLPDSAVSEVILFDAAQVLKKANTASNKYHYYDSFICMIELLQPALSLVIVGAGNDAIPLVQMATVLGWQTTIVDGRTNYATVERFPSAGKVIVAKSNEVISRVAIDARTVFMLMTHNYNYDAALLSALLGFPLPYIGVLGPKKRLMRILDEIISEPTIPDNLYGPAGLDIGSENAEEIALAIVSEIQSVLNKRKGESLRTKPVIHDRHIDRELQGSTAETLN